MKFPRIMIAAPNSGSGKTTIVCGLLQALKNMGHSPCSFKCGPDYIDPMYHRNVLDVPAGNLDTFFTDSKTTLALFQEEYEGDVAVIEGVMGLYDGVGGIGEMGSSYDLAHILNCPIVLVVDARGAGKSVLAQIKGFLDYDQYGLIQAVILNKTSPEFGKILKPLIEKELHISCLGVLPNEKNLTLGSRHLGLVLPEEIKDLKSRQKELADILAEHVSLEEFLNIANNAKEIKVVNEQECFALPRYKGTLRLAVARDEAFCFYYRENLSLLEKAGVEIVEFSPIRDEALPEHISGLLLGGGYPENYLKELSENTAMKTAIKEAVSKGLPTLAECGGFLYLLDEIKDDENRSFPMVGAIEGRAFWTGRLSRFGYVSVSDKNGMSIKGHEFHYYDTTNNGTDCMAKKPAGNRSWQCIHNQKGSYMGFPHLYYPSNVSVVAQFVGNMESFSSEKYCKDIKVSKEENNCKEEIQSTLKSCEDIIDDILKQKISAAPLDITVYQKMKKEWDKVSKPIGSFGEFETIYSKIATIQKKDEADLNHMRMVVFCGDHGIVEKGVSQTGQEVTRLCATNIGKGLTTAGVMAKSLGIDVVSVDVGINFPQEVPFTRYRRVKNGTNSFLKEPAMSLAEFKAALFVGLDMAFESKSKGYSCLLVGEMGIGNTTSAAVMAGYLLNLDADMVTGRGAGLNDASFAKKKEVVSKALAMYDHLSTEEICCRFGGLELAAMTGFIMGGALYEIPVILDGMLSMTSALVAERLLKNSKDYIIPSHMSKEPVAQKLAKELDVAPVIYGKMAVGEGAGAVMLVPTLRLTDVVFKEALKFGDSGVDQYENYTEGK